MPNLAPAVPSGRHDAELTLAFVEIHHPYRVHRGLASVWWMRLHRVERNTAATSSAEVQPLHTN